jgi:hypothetical protein
VDSLTREGNYLRVGIADHRTLKKQNDNLISELTSKQALMKKELERLSAIAGEI